MIKLTIFFGSGDVSEGDFNKELTKGLDQDFRWTPTLLENFMAKNSGTDKPPSFNFSQRKTPGRQILTGPVPRVSYITVGLPSFHKFEGFNVSVGDDLDKIESMREICYQEFLFLLS